MGIAFFPVVDWLTPRSLFFRQFIVYLNSVSSTSLTTDSLPQRRSAWPCTAEEHLRLWLCNPGAPGHGSCPRRILVRWWRNHTIIFISSMCRIFFVGMTGFTDALLLVVPQGQRSPPPGAPANSTKNPSIAYGPTHLPLEALLPALLADAVPFFSASQSTFKVQDTPLHCVGLFLLSECFCLSFKFKKFVLSFKKTIHLHILPFWGCCSDSVRRFFPPTFFCYFIFLDISGSTPNLFIFFFPPGISIKG